MRAVGAMLCVAEPVGSTKLKFSGAWGADRCEGKGGWMGMGDRERGGCGCATSVLPHSLAWLAHYASVCIQKRVQQAPPRSAHRDRVQVGDALRTCELRGGPGDADGAGGRARRPAGDVDQEAANGRGHLGIVPGQVHEGLARERHCTAGAGAACRGDGYLSALQQDGERVAYRR